MLGDWLGSGTAFEEDFVATGFGMHLGMSTPLCNNLLVVEDSS